MAGVIAQTDTAGPVTAAPTSHGTPAASTSSTSSTACKTGARACQHGLVQAKRGAGAQRWCRGEEEPPYAAVMGPLWGVREGSRAHAVPRFTTRAQTLVEQGFLQRQALVAL